MKVRPLLRSLVVLVTICSWFAISNHCALAVLATPTIGSECCPMHPKPVQQEQGSGSVCCKVLRASAASTIRTSAPQIQLLAGADLLSLVALPHSLGSAPQLVALDTGPPRVGSFAETVLQRSLLSHAPPSLG